jgi:hypothetical protein
VILTTLYLIGVKNTDTYPQGFQVPEFKKFTGEDNQTSTEHVGQFIAQCGEASNSDAVKLRLFPFSLSGIAFTWFTLLAPNSIRTWSQMEHKFHDYFCSGHSKLKLDIANNQTAIAVLEHISSIPDKPSKCATNLVDQKFKPFACSSLVLVLPKNRQMGSKYTFDVTECDKIFDILLEGKKVRLLHDHVIPSQEEIEGRIYCKWHGSFYHSTSDCNGP